MPANMNNGGDVLARGATRATFRQPNVTEEKYNEAVGDFDLEKFLGKKSGGSDNETPGDANAATSSGE